MKLLEIISRREVIMAYLDGEAAKKNRPISQSFCALDFDDPNAIDRWLKRNNYKPGVLGGFRQWALIELSTEDIGQIAIVNSIFKSGQRVLKNLAKAQELADWVPNCNPLPTWFQPLWLAEWKDEHSVILRPPTPGERREGAKLYVEDGSGRSICYYRTLQRIEGPSRMRGYFGFDPDPNSLFLQRNLEGEFATNATQYSTLQSTLATICLRLGEQA
jgi:hypothetical protein